MKNTPAKNVIATFTIIFSVVTIFVMFAPALASTSSNGSALGSVFHIMFPNTARGYNAVPLLIVGFALAIVGALVSLSGYFLEGKARRILLLSEAVMFAIVGIVFIFTPVLFASANGMTLDDLARIDENGGLGAGSICVIVFSFLIVAINLLALLMARKEAENAPKAPAKHR